MARYPFDDDDEECLISSSVCVTARICREGTITSKHHPSPDQQSKCRPRPSDREHEVSRHCHQNQRSGTQAATRRKKILNHCVTTPK
jgi:hypothetical protein